MGESSCSGHPRKCQTIAHALHHLDCGDSRRVWTEHRLKRRPLLITLKADCKNPTRDRERGRLSFKFHTSESLDHASISSNTSAIPFPLRIYTSSSHLVLFQVGLRSFITVTILFQSLRIPVTGSLGAKRSKHLLQYSSSPHTHTCFQVRSYKTV